MSAQPIQLSAMFCDDFRLEVSGKFSLIGCYGPDMGVPSFPTRLPKLCAFTSMLFSVSARPEKLSFELRNNAEVLAEIDLPVSKLPDMSADGPHELFIHLTLERQFLTLEKATELTVVAIIEGLEYVAGRLKVVDANTLSPPIAQPQ